MKPRKHFQRLKQLTNDEYRKLKSWLDHKHAGWERHLGLENRRAPGDGRGRADRAHQWAVGMGQR